MNKIIPLLIINLSTLLLSNLAHAGVTRLMSYHELLHALKNGHHVSAVGDNSKCKHVPRPSSTSADSVTPDKDMIMGISFNTNFFITYRDENDPRTHILTVATNTVAGPEKGPLYRYKSIKIFDDNSAEMYVARGQFGTGKSEGSYKTVCALSNGQDQNGMSLFDYDA